MLPLPCNYRQRRYIMSSAGISKKAETVNRINESITKCCRNICCALPRAHGVLPLPGNYQTKGDSVTCADVSTQLKLLTGATST
jgi:hypothetical protein